MWTFFLWYVWCRVKKWVNTTNVCFVGLLLGIPRGWSLWFEHHVHLCRCQLNYKNKADKADCSDRFFYHSVIMNVIVTWCCIILLVFTKEKYLIDIVLYYCICWIFKVFVFQWVLMYFNPLNVNLLAGPICI